jgi:hypothetical protein
MMNKIAKKTFFSIIVAAFLLIPVFADAEESDFFPNVLNGQLMIERSAGLANNNHYFDGMGGNEAVVNWGNDYLFEFTENASKGCAGTSDITSLVPCFILSAPTGFSGQIMRSLTYLNGTAEIETGALIYPRKSIIGDVYGTTGVNLPGFKQFGKNLYQSGGGTGGSTAFYQIGNYKFNPSAQAAWNDGNNKAMADTVSRLKEDTKGLQSNNVVLSTRNWNTGLTNFDGICGGSTTCDDQNQYPNGRVWGNPSDIGDVNIGFGTPVAPNPLNYNKKATVLVQSGNLNINVNIIKKNTISSLGFIVENGNVVIQNSSPKKIVVEASIFAPKGTITVIGNNIDLIGSFVAKDFIINGINGGAATYNINFIQDTRPSDVRPPGFRDLIPLSRISN